MHFFSLQALAIHRERKNAFFSLQAHAIHIELIKQIKKKYKNEKNCFIIFSFVIIVFLLLFFIFFDTTLLCLEMMAVYSEMT